MRAVNKVLLFNVHSAAETSVSGLHTANDNICVALQISEQFCLKAETRQSIICRAQERF